MAKPTRRIANVEKVCEFCGKRFLAKTVITRFCYDEACRKDRSSAYRRELRVKRTANSLS